MANSTSCAPCSRSVSPHAYYDVRFHTSFTNSPSINLRPSRPSRWNRCCSHFSLSLSLSLSLSCWLSGNLLGCLYPLAAPFHVHLQMEIAPADRPISWGKGTRRISAGSVSFLQPHRHSKTTQNFFRPINQYEFFLLLRPQRRAIVKLKWWSAVSFLCWRSHCCRNAPWNAKLRFPTVPARDRNLHRRRSNPSA